MYCFISYIFIPKRKGRFSEKGICKCFDGTSKQIHKYIITVLTRDQLSTCMQVQTPIEEFHLYNHIIC